MGYTQSETTPLVADKLWNASYKGFVQSTGDRFFPENQRYFAKNIVTPIFSIDHRIK
jgi:hypothetical protein